MSWRVRLGTRVGRLAAGVFTVAVLLFAVPARLPGGSEAAFLGSHSDDPAARAALRRDLHLDETPPFQFLHFLDGAAHGDLGRSPVSGVDVGAVVGERLVESVALAAAAGAIAWLVVGRRRRT